MEVLKKLVELHQIDKQILELTQQLASIPERIASLERKLKDWNLDVQTVHNRWKELRTRREEQEQRVARLEQQIDNLNQNARQARSNREYSEYLLRLEDTRHQIRNAEDELLELMEAEEQAFQEWKAEEAAHQERLKVNHTQCEELRSLQAQLEAEHKVFQEKRQALFLTIPKNYCQQYEHIARNRSGIAMAEVRKQTCEACHIQIRPRLYQALITMDELVLCESCQRILYLPEVLAEEEHPAPRG